MGAGTGQWTYRTSLSLSQPGRYTYRANILGLPKLAFLGVGFF